MSKKKKTERSKKQIDIGERSTKYLMDSGNIIVDGRLVRSNRDAEPETTRLRRRRVRNKRKRRHEHAPTSQERLNAEYRAEVAKKRREERRKRAR